MSFARIVGTGSFLPPNIISNADLVSQLASRGIETSDDWIYSRSGIQSRRFADHQSQTSDLAVAAASRAMSAAAIEADAIDLIVVATTTPDAIFPSTACLVQRKLGIRNGCAAFDIQAVCGGFIYALTVADALIRGTSVKTALVIGAETFSRLLDFEDRNTCVLFGDGAGAVILRSSEEPGILGAALHADGHHSEILKVSGSIAGGAVLGDPFLRMDGPAVFKLAVGALQAVSEEVAAQCGLAMSDFTWVVPHQANIRIMEATARKLGIPVDRLVSTVHEHGNTSAASIPLALDQAYRDGRICRGDRVLMHAVGAGVTWGALAMLA
ncbi:beta-ketoacyl-ACP synthase III [Paraburkholderia elongata]|uniref:Beta-ketoacyl-[acyl-carrier-protein] synthase III n=1 Tax=Paraburkholderia elongata TaxID=2675747 RepID=A0A972SGR3_9BURK|nr:beta-ketoacyl-ACP synthase III [Paraburkholderia elongata]NPT54224.1 beta-ketoacyl-ACP synthase III [Paraburkholderia elongata]